MKRYVIYVVLSLLTLTSCKKNISTEQQSAIETDALYASGSNAAELTTNKEQVVRVDITGGQFQNPCTGGTLTVLRGILQFNIAPDGVTIRSTVNSRLVMQDAAGTIYHGVFVETFGLNGSISKGTVHDTLRFVLNPEGGGTNLHLHSMFHITINANGVFTVDISQFTLSCS